MFIIYILLKKKKMKNYITLTLISIALPLFSQTTITKNLGDYSVLKVYNGIELELIKSSESKLEITGKKSEKVTIKNINNTLKIALPFSINPANNSAGGEVLVKLFYNTPIAVIDANEGATITGKKLSQETLEVNAQERAFINLVLECKHLEVRASSGGIIKLTGTTKNQDVNVDLYGIYNGYALQVSANTVVKAGTGAKAEVFAGETLKGKVSFGGSIFYKGNPEVLKDKKVVGGIIQKRD